MQFGRFGKEARMNKVEGNLDSIKKATVEYAQSFIGETFSPGEFSPGRGRFHDEAGDGRKRT